MKIVLLGLLISLNAFAGFDHTHQKWDQILKQYTTRKGNQVYFKYKVLKENEAPLSPTLVSLNQFIM
jgi:hypothetical protein